MQISDQGGEVKIKRIDLQLASQIPLVQEQR